MGYVVATQSFAVGNQMIRRGSILDDGHEIVKGAPGLFKPFDPTIEQTTAAPGEVRVVPDRPADGAEQAVKRHPAVDRPGGAPQETPVEPPESDAETEAPKRPSVVDGKSLWQEYARHIGVPADGRKEDIVNAVKAWEATQGDGG